MASQDGGAEQVFLAKLTKCLGRPLPDTRPTRPAALRPELSPVNAANSDQLISEFTSNCTKLTTRCTVVPDITQLQASISALLAELKAKSVITWNSAKILQAGIPDICRASGVNVTLWDNLAARATMLRRCASVDVGITWADFAIANTGTLAIMSNPQQSRVVSLLPPVHIAVVDQNKLLPTLGNVFAQLDAAKMPAAVNFITGPSRTSDIEMDLALGVHGPGQVFVLILDSSVTN
ncbi:MAG: lactate utilization protein C [Peptococcaceae bacterium]|nr:lactate utilization protein C [Peptococcaceae bacterium]